MVKTYRVFTLHTQFDSLEMCVHTDVHAHYCANDRCTVLQLNSDRLIDELHQEFDQLHLSIMGVKQGFWGFGVLGFWGLQCDRRRGSKPRTRPQTESTDRK